MARLAYFDIAAVLVVSALVSRAWSQECGGADDGTSMLTVRHAARKDPGAAKSTVLPEFLPGIYAPAARPGAADGRQQQTQQPAAKGQQQTQRRGKGRSAKAAAPRCDECAVKALVENMTQEEKYSMLSGYGWNQWNPEPGLCVGNTPAIERLGIPRLCMMDNGDGFRTYIPQQIGQVTSWPCPLGVSATWDEAMVEEWATEMAKEFVIKGSNVMLGPGLNVHRVARNGRNAEYMSGESPYLGTRMAPPFVRGVQSQPVLAVMKHFIGNNQETHRDNVNNLVDQRTLFEVYYPPFQAAVEADVGATMCSYNLVNGKHACAQGKVLEQDLKGVMAYPHWVMSDWWAAWKLGDANDGLDQEMPGDVIGLDSSKRWVFTASGLDLLDAAKVDSMVSRILLPMQKYGLMDEGNLGCPPNGCAYAWYNASATSPERTALSKRLATSSVIMLKNDGVLPIGPDVKTIAVLGEACNATNDIKSELADWTGGSYYVIGGSGRVIPPKVVSPLQGIEEYCKTAGCKVTYEPSSDVMKAFATAREADVAIACGGATSTESLDRPSLSVDQESYLVTLAALTITPLVTLTMTPGTIVMPWIDDVNAALNIFLGGEFTGEAFANVLFGRFNPAAKSPVTFPKREGAMVAPCIGPPVCDPPDCSYDCAYSEGLFVGFAGVADEDVLFPFGHGLSYTNFSYRSVALLPAANASSSSQYEGSCKDAVVCVIAEITNVGKMAGGEVAQLYLGYPKNAKEPSKVLRGFKKLELEPGSKGIVSFPLHRRDVQIWSEDANTWQYPDGKFTVFVGSSSRDIRITEAFNMLEGVAYSAPDKF